MDFIENNSNLDLSNAFKIINFVVGLLTVLCGVSQLTNGLQQFLIGLYVIASGALIIFLELRLPQEVYSYVSFMFSFIGRGVFYLLIGILVAHDHFMRIFPGFLVSLVGLAYIALQFVPSIVPPENMRSEFAALNSGDEEDVI